ncbi:hypothetical protein HRQ65_06695 [Tatlockia micdadei]|uniref:hypothetical protein n=1 Tax=Legionella micdadei TaxID=451 RepID=UPI00156FA033|nr:hypothetical protein [Legionella micdadei]NSL18068.1 hypothetical protein [Legionella micdadei]
MGEGLQPNETIKEKIDAQSAEAALISARKQVLEMQEPVSFTPRPMPPDALTIALIKKIPFLANFLRSVDATGVAVSKLAYIQGNELAGTVNSSFRIAGAVIAFIDFVRIPAMYFAAWLLGQPLPITLSQNAKWLYSAVVLALSFAGLLAPTAVAPFIALAAASLACFVSIFTLGKHFYDRYQTKELLRQTKQKADWAEVELQQMMRAAKKLGTLLNDPEKKQNYPAYIEHVETLQEDIDEKKEELQELYDKQLETLQILEELGWAGVLHKTVGISFAAAALVGLALSLTFPLVGLAIFGASAAGGSLYILGRLIHMVIPIIIEKINKSAAEPTNEQAADPNSLSIEKMLLVERIPSPVESKPCLIKNAESLKQGAPGTTGLRLFDDKGTILKGERETFLQQNCGHSELATAELRENNSECVL